MNRGIKENLLLTIVFGHLMDLVQTLKDIITPTLQSKNQVLVFHTLIKNMYIKYWENKFFKMLLRDITVVYLRMVKQVRESHTP